MMPDISMCLSTTCPMKSRCYRNKESGTVPSEYRQAYLIFPDGWAEPCKYLWIRGEEKG